MPKSVKSVPCLYSFSALAGSVDGKIILKGRIDDTVVVNACHCDFCTDCECGNMSNAL